MLEKLRAKSDNIKKSISLIATIVIFSGIAFVWVSSWDAQSTEESTREKTVAPLGGVASMFDGLVMDIKDVISGMPSFVKTDAALPTSTPAVTATSTTDFDMSGVVIIDSTESTTTSTSSVLTQ